MGSGRRGYIFKYFTHSKVHGALLPKHNTRSTAGCFLTWRRFADVHWSGRYYHVLDNEIEPILGRLVGELRPVASHVHHRKARFDVVTPFSNFLGRDLRGGSLVEVGQSTVPAFGQMMSEKTGCHTFQPRAQPRAQPQICRKLEALRIAR